MRILIVEDDPHLSKVLKIALETQSYVIDLFTDGKLGFEAGLKNSYDVIVLDVTLPSMNGMDVCRSFRDHNVTTPIIMLTGLDGHKHKVAGLDHGADDYLTKPFSNEELYARIRALLRRKPDSHGPILKTGSLSLDPTKHQVTRNGKIIALRPKEYALLEYLMYNAGTALTREEMFQHVWGINANNTSNRLEVYIKYLREKLATDSEPDLIHTIRGVGYKLAEQD